MPWTILIILNLETLTSAWPLQPSLLPCLLLLHPAVTFHLFIYPGWWPVIMFFWVHPKLDMPWPQDFLDIHWSQAVGFGCNRENVTFWPRLIQLHKMSSEATLDVSETAAHQPATKLASLYFLPSAMMIPRVTILTKSLEIWPDSCHCDSLVDSQSMSLYI